MSIELFADTVDLSSVHVEEALEDGSFTYTDGNSPSARLKLVVRGALEAYPAYMAVINYLQRNYGDDGGYISLNNIPLGTIQLNKLACDFAYTAECTFQYEENSSNVEEDGSANSRESNRRGTSSNNPTINNSDFQMPEVQSSDFQYSTTGGSMHLTHAYSQDYYILTPEATTHVDHYNGIGEVNDGVYEGVDVVCPSEVFSVTLSAPNYWLNTYYRTLVTQCTGCTNEKPFWGYAPECVLFKGLSASSVALNYTDQNGNAVKSWYWRLRYEFEARQSVTIYPPTEQTGARVVVFEHDSSSESGEEDDSESDNNGSENSSSSSSNPIWSPAKDYDRKTAIVDAIATLKDIVVEAPITEAIFNELVYSIVEEGGMPFHRFCQLVYGEENAFDDNYRLFYNRVIANVLKYVSLSNELEAINISGCINKPGFRYIWFSNPKKVTDSHGKIISHYLQANLAQVYPTVDFSVLNLPELSDAD